MGKIKVDELEERVSNSGITVNSTLKGAVLQDYAEVDQDISSSATLAIDLANGNTGSVTLGTNVTDIDFTNVPTSGVSTFTLIVTQDGTGSRTASFGSVWDFIGGTAPTLTTTASAVDRLDYIVRSSTKIHAVVTLAYS